MPTILLDRSQDGLRPEGYLCIETEIDFLDKALSADALFIRGERLCNWAENFYKGRSIELRDAPSPVRNLQEIFPALSVQQAELICQRLGEKFFESHSLVTAWTILSMLSPTNLWTDEPSKQHAAEWLLWLDQEAPDESLHPMLREVALSWQHTMPEFQTVYAAFTAAEAQGLLEQWLGVQGADLASRLGEFPVAIPEVWKNRARSVWREKIIETHGQYLGRLVNAPLPRSLRYLAAMEALNYFEANTDDLSPESYEQVARFAAGKERERLIAIKPATEPRDLPGDPAAVFKWFLEEYAPYRLWQAGVNAPRAHSRVKQLATQFAHWYLKYYPIALNSKKHISFYRSQALRQDSQHVTLLIVLDGLHVFDAQTVVQSLLTFKGIHQLGMIENGLCFAPIPTVTDFAKGALLRGAQPSLIRELAVLGEDVSERETPLERLQLAKPGELFIWKIQEPDHSYHSRNKYQTLAVDIQGQLNTIAQKVIDLVENVASAISLRIVITTDHGRFLGNSERTITVPPGMEAHGRAAWGQVDGSFEAQGYYIVDTDNDDSVVYLSKDRFGLSDDAAVVLSDKAFKTADGKQKSELYTHGGLFPEEVIIPWIVFERDICKPDIKVSILGEGQANLAGALTVSFTNASQINLIISSIELDFGPGKILKQFPNCPIGAYKSDKIQVGIPSWPSSEQVLNGQARIGVRLPDHDVIELSASLADLRVLELYTRDKSFLEGLDL